MPRIYPDMQRDQRSRQTIFCHGGYEMRSHSETRWASIMDVLGVRWLYEPRVIDTRHGWYLPDFYLPACGVFVEVKGPAPVLEEIEKAHDAEEATGCPVIFAHGDPEMDHGQLLGGLLTYYGKNQYMDFSTVELGALIRKYCDLHTYAAFLTAGDRRERPNATSVSETINEVVASWMDRNAIEDWKRQLHRPLNEAKNLECGQHSLAEWFVGVFSASIARKRAEMIKEEYAA